MNGNQNQQTQNIQYHQQQALQNTQIDSIQYSIPQNFTEQELQQHLSQEQVNQLYGQLAVAQDRNAIGQHFDQNNQFFQSQIDFQNKLDLFTQGQQVDGIAQDINQLGEEDIMNLQNYYLQNQGIEFDGEDIDFNQFQQQQHLHDYQQQFNFGQQQQIQELQNRLREQNPNISMQELQNAIEYHFIQNNQIQPWYTDEQVQQISSGFQNDIQLPQSLQELVNRTNHEYARQYQREGIEQQISQAFLHGIQNQINPGQDQYQQEYQHNLYNIENIQQDLMKIKGHHGDINYAQIQQSMINNNEVQNQSIASSSTDTEKQIENEKKRDQNFRRQLRNFYKSMIENISPEVNQEIQKQQELLCEQIDQAKRNFINDKKELKKERKKNQYNQMLSQTSSSDSIDLSKIDEYDDADSIFQGYLFNNNSQIDPDIFIKNVMSHIESDEGMLKWFKRFLPDDDDQDQESMQRKFIKIQQSIIPHGQEGQLDFENQNINSNIITMMKSELFDNMIDYLKEYSEVKDNKGIEVALELYGSKIMMLVESYQKYASQDIQNQYQIEYEKQRIAMGIESDNNLYANDEINMKIGQIYNEKLESQLNLILQIIPQEIIDNYSLSSPANLAGKNNYDDDSVSYNHQESEKNLKLQKLKNSDVQDLKKQQPKVLNKKDDKNKPRRLIDRQGDQNFYQKQKQKSDSENSLTGFQDSNRKKRINKNLIKNKQKEKSDLSQESQKDFDLELEQEQYSNDKQNELKNENQVKDYYSDEFPDNINPNRQQLIQDRVDGQYQIQRMKPIISELANNYQITNLNKQELQTFENLQKQIRFEDDWQSFTKIFLLYFQGVISQKDFFMLFEDKFGPRLKSDLKKEVQSLIPTRENQRRLQSEILKPWNDLENQQFVKIYDSSYYKIDLNFPLPICQEKVNPKNQGHYQDFLNDKYLSLSTGSENFKFKIRNINEDLIFKNEDEMYKLDRQIEMIKKFLEIIQDELQKYSYLTLKERQCYKFPKHKLRVLIQYMEKKYKLLMQQTMENPFKEEIFIQLNEGLQSKLNELQNQKYDQLPQFEEVFRKNFVKSLDHRSILYNKEFIKKFLQKQQHMTEIKHAAQQNNDGSIKHINLLKGGNFKDSPFYHSFGSFLKNENTIFDIGEVSDYPIDMKFLDDLDDIQPKIIEKLPHSRLVFKDKDSVQIAIKIILLHINYSQTHHLNDRPRLIQTIKSVLVNFMQFQDFDILQKQCENSVKNPKIENIKPKQIELIMNQDSHQWYLKRCQQILKNLNENNEIQNCPNQNQIQQNAKDFQRSLRARGFGESIEKDILQDVPPIKIEIQQNSTILKNLQDISNQNDQNLDKESQSNKSKKESNQTESDEEKSSQNLKNEKIQHLKQIYKLQQIKVGEQTEENSLNQINESLFLPFYDNNKNSEKHSLFYAPSNVFMFLRFFYALYERIYYSKQLIIEKINQDLSEISKENKIKHGIINQETGEIVTELYENVFINERYEHLLKGIFATTTQQGFGQAQGIAGQLQIIGHGYSHNQQIMDHNKYEDFTRQLLGKNAFLLFQIYKIVSQAIKQVAQMYSDQSYKEALKLYENLNSDHQNKISNCKINEMTYLQNYTQQIVDQFQLSEYQEKNQGQSGKQFITNQNECQHTCNIFEKNKQNLDQSSKFDVQNTQAQAAQYSSALNATSAIQQQNFQFFRLLWSNKTQILSIHYININPNISQVTTGRNYYKIMQDNYNTIATSTVQPIKNVGRILGENECQCQVNKLKDSNSNIFLRRNFTKMNQYRKMEDISKKSEVINGMTLRFLSNQNNIQYDVQGEDVFLWKGEKGKAKDVRNRKSKLKVNDYILQDFQKQCHAGEIRAKRLKTLEEQ